MLLKVRLLIQWTRQKLFRAILKPAIRSIPKQAKAPAISASRSNSYRLRLNSESRSLREFDPIDGLSQLGYTEREAAAALRARGG